MDHGEGKETLGSSVGHFCLAILSQFRLTLSRHGLVIQLRLALNSQFSCLSLPSTGIPSVCRCLWLIHLHLCLSDLSTPPQLFDLFKQI